MTATTSLLSAIVRLWSVPPAPSTTKVTRNFHLAPSTLVIGTGIEVPSRPRRKPRTSPPSHLSSYPTRSAGGAATFCAISATTRKPSRLGGCFVGRSMNDLGQQRAPLFRAKIRLFSSQQPEADEASPNGNAVGDDGDGEFSGASDDDGRSELELSWRDRSFSEMIKELRAHHDKFGSCYVPKFYPPNPMMSKWVMHQRNNLQLFKKGRPSRLTEDQAQQLLELDLMVKNNWERMLSALALYQSKEGHCNVPSNYPPHPALATWVVTQRWLYNVGSQRMTPDRIAKLDELSFSWKLRGRHRQWWDVYKVLLEHHGQHGDLNSVATDSPNGVFITKWCERQRVQYNRRQKGKQTSLTSDRVQALDDLGFIWDRPAAKWMENLQLLRSFRKIHGHCRVPNIGNGHDQLTQWVRYQRLARKRGEAGLVQAMPRERIELLDGEGFVWDPHEEAWLNHFETLVDFRRKYGHCRVPEPVKANTKFKVIYRWVLRQRNAYWASIEGKQSPLTAERKLRLENIGFRFDPHWKE